MHVRPSSMRPRVAAILAACSTLALLGTAGLAEAASQRPPGSCTNHPDKPGCASEPAADAALEPEQPVVEEPTPEPDEPTETPPDPEPQPEPDAIDDPPTIISGSSDPPPVDECRNLDGAQADVPEGMYLDTYGNCVEPPNMTAGDGVDDEVEEGGLPDGSTAGGAAGGSGGAPPSVGGAGGESAGGVSANSVDGAATAVAGAAAVPTFTTQHDTAGSLDAAQDDRLPFTGLPLAALAIGGLMLALLGAVLTLVRRVRRPSVRA